ncbi:hypothetical protein OROMI_006853 [Orobanche minor]
MKQPSDALKVAKVLCICYLIFSVDGGKRIVYRRCGRWLRTRLGGELSMGLIFISDIDYVFERYSHLGPHWSGSEYGLARLYLREAPNVGPCSELLSSSDLVVHAGVGSGALGHSICLGL